MNKYSRSLKNKKSKNHNKYTRKASISYDHKQMSVMSLSGNDNGKFIPEFKIINGPAYATVIMNLKQDQEVYDQKGAVNYADSTINVNTKTGGFFKSMFRSLVTSESMFMTYYKGMRAEPSIISFSSVLPGDMFAVKIKPGKRYLISQNSFVCATQNVVLSTDLRFKNILESTNMFLTVASIPVDSKDDGMIWVAAYGGYERLNIPAGQSIKVEHGLFCLSDANLDYTIAKMGGLKTFFFIM